MHRLVETRAPEDLEKCPKWFVGKISYNLKINLDQIENAIFPILQKWVQVLLCYVFVSWDVRIVRHLSSVFANDIWHNWKPIAISIELSTDEIVLAAVTIDTYR